MSADIFISIVLCTFNGEQFLWEQLKSIQRQTHTNFELIISDDASTDGTPQIVKAFAAEDDRVRILINEKNVGFNKNFEQGLQIASAHWIALSDQDDIWLPDKLTKLVECIKPGVSLIHSYNAEFTGEDSSKTIINRSRTRFRGNSTRKLLFYNTVIGHTALIDKKLLQHALPFPAGVYYDWWLGVIASVYGSVELNHEVLVLHRQHSSNASKFFHSNSIQLQKETYFEEVKATLRAFSYIPDLQENDKRLLEEYQALIQTEWRKSFSFPVFFFFIKHARDAFYFRKKSPLFFYHFKYSFKRATMKIKHWL